MYDPTIQGKEEIINEEVNGTPIIEDTLEEINDDAVIAEELHAEGIAEVVGDEEIAG